MSKNKIKTTVKIVEVVPALVITPSVFISFSPHLIEDSVGDIEI